MSCTRTWLVTALLLVAARAHSAGPVEASPSQGTTLSIYDAGYALVTENRRVNLVRGENEVVFRPVPATLDPASVSLAPLGGPVEVRLLDTRFEHDGASVERLFARYVGRAITVQDGVGTREGELLAAPVRGGSFLLLDAGAGATRAVGLSGVREVVFPRAATTAYLEPALVGRVASAQEGLQNLRLGYLAHQVEWSAHHEVTVAPDGARARFDTRVRVANQSGSDFTEARIKLITTARGQADAGSEDAADLRFRYGGAEPVAAPQAVGLAPAQTYELGRPLTVRAGEVAFVPLAAAEQLAVTRFYVYDGVKFDRFPRNRRTDWNLGTVCQNTVDTHLEFANAKGSGLGQDLPPGRLRVLQARADGTVDFLGEDVLQATGAGAVGQVRVGPARGLLGERERTGYTEIKPLHEYEETFAIRLTNLGEETVQVRVVEHLYRWSEFEITKADAEYVKTGPQRIEFRPELKAGGRRSLHYTVRYRW
jgi:hypothetical protein